MNDGWLAIELIGASVRLVEEDGLLVLDAEEAGEPLLDQHVRHAIEVERTVRAQRWG